MSIGRTLVTVTGLCQYVGKKQGQRTAFGQDVRTYIRVLSSVGAVFINSPGNQLYVLCNSRSFRLLCLQMKVAGGPGGWHLVYSSTSQGLSVNRFVVSIICSAMQLHIFDILHILNSTLSDQLILIQFLRKQFCNQHTSLDSHCDVNIMIIKLI